MMIAYAAFGLIKLLILIYTWLTYPFYLMCGCRKSPNDENKIIARVVQRSGNSEVTYRCTEFPCPPRKEVLEHPDHIDTLAKLFNFIVKKHGDKRALGTREVLGEEEEKQSDGKVLQKIIFGNYTWMSYNEAEAKIDHFGKGIRELGVLPGDRVCIFADTRVDWLIAALGCFKNRIALCTIYTNLGEDGIVHGITQTQVSTVITSAELYKKLVAVRERIPAVKNLIYFENPLRPKPDADGHDLEFHSMSKVLMLGRKSTISSEHPEPNDTAIIMYTSGSTGVPKGVILTHKNMVSAILSLVTMASRAIDQFGEVTEDDTYIAFLPLAHVLEMLAEHVMLLLGVKIGYSNPNTLTDKSTMIKSGEKGDATVLSPTVMAAVPLILDRIYKGIQNNIASQGILKQLLVNYCFEYREQWMRMGFSTPIMDKLIFSKMKALIGGKLKVLLSGGAPLSEDAQVYIRSALCCKLLQGYGLTETSATATITDPGDLSTGNVGPPLMGVDIKLVNWDEGGYTIHDNIGPRGEIVVGGDHVSTGYYNMPEKTLEDFYQSDGKQFFKTGDIGQLLPNGSIKIIDRKKDLVKLQHGEYVSLGKVESNLKINPLIDNICVFGNSFSTFMVAIVVPDEVKLVELANKMNREHKRREDLCTDLVIVKAIADSIVKQGQSAKLEKFEIPKKIRLVPDSWTPESGLVTAAFKLRRKPIQNKFQHLLDAMYSEQDGSTVIKMSEIRSKQENIILSNNNNKVAPA